MSNEPSYCQVKKKIWWLGIQRDSPQNPADKTQMFPFDFCWFCWAKGELSPGLLSGSLSGRQLDTWAYPHPGTILEYLALWDVSPWEGRGATLHISNINSVNLKCFLSLTVRYFAWLVSGKCSKSFLLFGNQRQYPALVISGAYPWFWGDQIWSDLLPLPPWPE